MSKGFTLAKTWEKATKLHEEIHVEDDILTLLYDELDDIKSEYSILWKIVEDFYGDVKLKPNELPILKNEIKKLIYNKKLDFAAVEFLNILKHLCDKGIKQRLTLWGIAD